MSRTSRRTFARSLLAAGAALPLADALAQCPPPYAQHLTPAELERIAADVQEVAPQLAAFRAFPLTNADEPDFV
jgi:hypothetical protein